MRFAIFCLRGVRETLRGGVWYWTWVGILTTIILAGVYAYSLQLREGLIVTGMSDQVSWGIYIANFTFLVGVAAAAVMLVIPSYIFHDQYAKSVVLLAEGIAVAACVMAMTFVVVDLGRPDRMWHMMPLIGRFNWPMSLLAWDVVVLSGYLGFNILVPTYFFYKKYLGEEPNKRKMFPVIVASVFWAIALHTVTAFLFSSNPGRPFWHTALLGPRFLASAFAAGPAVIILALRIIDARTEFKVPRQVTKLLAIIATIALQVNLIMLGAEIFTEFYSATTHAASAQYLFVGLHGHHALVPWVYSAICMEIVALVILMVEKWRHNIVALTFACTFATTGIWIEKGMGLIIPGFIPTPLGEILEYTPASAEMVVSLGIWAGGLLLFTFLAKAGVSIELGKLRLNNGVTSSVSSA